MTAVNWARLVLVVIVGLLLQAAVLDQVTLLGAHADVMVLIAAAAGIAIGAERGAMAGFVCGLFADLITNTPFGLSPLTFVLVAFATGLARETVVGRGVDAAQALVCVGAAAAGTILYAIIGALIGQHGMLGTATAEALLSVTLGGVILSYPTLVAMRWTYVGIRQGGGAPIPSGGSAVG